MKIFTVIGARPQFIKEAAIQNQLRKHSHITEVVVHTGQHYDENMSGVFFEVLNMNKPDYNLGVQAMRHGEMTGKILTGLEELMIKEKPDVVLLHGDTNSTLAGAISASKLKIPIAHVEAGVRQSVIDMPEEINRVLTDRISSILFCPSQAGVDNLKMENNRGKIVFAGNIMYDVYKIMEHRFDHSLINELGLKENSYVVATIHRDFNVDREEILREILMQLNAIAADLRVVLPIHPRTRKRVGTFGLESLLKPLTVIPPVDYLKLMGLTQHCAYVVTDSGGYQCEAYFAKKRAIVIMEDTAWIELVGKQTFLCRPDGILLTIRNTETSNYIENIYGDGTAANKIVEVLNEMC